MDVEQYKSLLAGMGVDSQAPSKPSLDFTEITDAQIDTFLKHLHGNDEAPSRIGNVILPSSDIRNLAKFIMFAIHPQVEARFRDDRQKRGRNARTSLRKRIRSGQEDQTTNLDAAARSFPTRGRGMSLNWSLLLIVREYIRYRAGAELRPLEWNALLGAAYAATGKIRDIDGDLVSANLRKFARKHPLIVPNGRKAVTIVEAHRLMPHRS